MIAKRPRVPRFFGAFVPQFEEVNPTCTCCRICKSRTESGAPKAALKRRTPNAVADFAGSRDVVNFIALFPNKKVQHWGSENAPAPHAKNNLTKVHLRV